MSEPAEIFVDPVEMHQAVLVVRASLHRPRQRFLLRNRGGIGGAGGDLRLDPGRNPF